MVSKAATVTEYLSSLPDDRKAAVTKIRAAIKKNLPKGLVETMQYGMIGYAVPHKLYPGGYHCDPKQPLPFAGLASQKQYISLYLMAIYQDPREQDWLREQFAAAGKRLDMGKSCLRFRKLEDVPMDVIAQAIGRVSVADYITLYEDKLKAQKSRSRAGK